MCFGGIHWATITAQWPYENIQMLQIYSYIYLLCVIFVAWIKLVSRWLTNGKHFKCIFFRMLTENLKKKLFLLCKHSYFISQCNVFYMRFFYCWSYCCCCCYCCYWNIFSVQLIFSVYTMYTKVLILIFRFGSFIFITISIETEVEEVHIWNVKSIWKCFLFQFNFFFEKFKIDDNNWINFDEIGS